MIGKFKNSTRKKSYHETGEEDPKYFMRCSSHSILFSLFWGFYIQCVNTASAERMRAAITSSFTQSSIIIVSRARTTSVFFSTLFSLPGFLSLKRYANWNWNPSLLWKGIKFIGEKKRREKKPQKSCNFSIYFFPLATSCVALWLSLFSDFILKDIFPLIPTTTVTVTTGVTLFSFLSQLPFAEKKVVLTPSGENGSCSGGTVVYYYEVEWVRAPSLVFF